MIFTQTVLCPSCFTDKAEYEEKRNAVNEALSYVGYELLETGKYRETTPVSTITEAQQRANNLLRALKSRNAHQEIFKCLVLIERPDAFE